MICKAILEGHEHLKELDLSANAIIGIGANAAAEAIANKPNFSRLFISWNFITKKGIETVKDMLRKVIKGDFVLGVLYQYKDEGGMLYQYKARGVSDSDTELEEKLQKPKVRYGSDSDSDTELEEKLQIRKVRYDIKIFSVGIYIRSILDTLNPTKLFCSFSNYR